MVESEFRARPHLLPMFLGLVTLPFLKFRSTRESGLCPMCLCVSDYSDSTEVKFEELKNVKLEEEDEEEEEEEEEEDQEGAALDLSVNPVSFGGRLVFSGSKKKSSSSLGSGSSRDSISSDSETSEPLSCRAQGQTGVLTVHSYAKGDDRVTAGESCTRKKGGATRSINERELAEVWVLGGVGGRGPPVLGREVVLGLGCCRVPDGRRDPQDGLPVCNCVKQKPGGSGSLQLVLLLGVSFSYLCGTVVPKNCLAASVAALGGSSAELGASSAPPGLGGQD